jgi:hypothetical protein
MDPPIAKEIRSLLSDPDFADQTRDVLAKIDRRTGAQ